MDGFELGQVMVIVPNGLWSTVAGRSGNWDIVALSTDGVRRQLVRGIFTVEQGVDVSESWCDFESSNCSWSKSPSSSVLSTGSSPCPGRPAPGSSC